MTYQCKQCGGQIYYIPGSLLLKCKHCLSVENIEVTTNQVPLHVFEEDHLLEKDTFSIVKCSSCGAEIIKSNIAIENCPYCTNVIINEEFIKKDVTQIDGMIPLKIEKKKAFENIKKWKKKLYLAPGNFKKQIQQLTFLKGTYIPYWLVESKTHVFYKGKCGQERINSKKINWTTENGEFITRLENIALLGSNSIPENIKDKTLPDFGEVVVEPWNNRWDFSELIQFNELFTLGYTAEIPHFSCNQVLKNQEKKIKYELEQKVIQKIEKSGCDHGLVNKLTYEHLELKYRLVLLPVWIGSYRYKNRLFQILVNGQSGEVVGDRPISKIKVAIMWFLIIVLILYIGFIIAFQNYLLWAIHILAIGVAIYLKSRKIKET